MADHNRTDDTTIDETTNRVAPRDVTPDRKKSGGTPGGDRSTTHDRGAGRDPEVVESTGGDIAGIAGGGVDDRVSGLGGDKNRR